jgi:N-acetylneuraminate synthase
VIAEIGINHNGSLELALRLIEEAARVGAQAVKFQKRDVPVVYSIAERHTLRKFDKSFIVNALKRAEIEGVEYPVFPERGQRDRLEAWIAGDDVPTYNGDLKYALEFGAKEWDTIRSHCEVFGLAWGVSAWDGLSVYEIDGFQPDFHKVASACLPHKDLLLRIRRCNRPVILSTGGSTMEQIRKAVDLLGRKNLVILHCTATYPSLDEEGNVAVVSTLRKEFHDVPIGYSGHEADTLASELAVSLGADVVERHITLDRLLPGSDQSASLEPAHFEDLIRKIRDIETKRGTRSMIEIADWAEQVHLDRLMVLMGDGKKRVFPREAEVMKKLRRISDF